MEVITYGKKLWFSIKIQGLGEKYVAKHGLGFKLASYQEIKVRYFYSYYG